jgi:hypothetical protein
VDEEMGEKEFARSELVILDLVWQAILGILRNGFGGYDFANFIRSDGVR